MFKIRGIVEGFYGRPWTWTERSDLIGESAKWGYNLYIYAPKADPLHRNRWREAYPADFKHEFKSLVELGKEVDLDVSMAISPGLSLVYSSDQDFETLKSKYLLFSQMGVRTISLFLDDIPENLVHEADRVKFKSLAHAQAAFSNRLFEALNEKIEDMRFIVCPTIYHGKKTTNYHETLGDLLNDKIKIMWTGPAVCSKEISAGDAEKIARAYKRPPLYWDNYPVNDSVMVPELHLGAYTGRDPELAKLSEGIVINPMNQAYASMIELGIIGQYLMNPEGFEPERTLDRYIEERYPDIARDMEHFIRANEKSPLHPDDPEITGELLMKLKAKWDNGKLDELSAILEDESKDILSAHKNISKGLDPKTKADIEPWLEEYKTYGNMLKAASGALREIKIVYLDEIPSKEKIESINAMNEAFEKQISAVAIFDTSIFGSSVRNFLTDLLKTCKGFLKLVDY